MRNKKFFDANHAHQYLAGSLIRHDGRPFLVSECGATKYKGIHSFHGSYTDKNYADDFHTILSNDEDIDMTPIPLGWLSVGDKSKVTTSVYVQRIPSRMWKVGLHRNNTTYYYADDVENANGINISVDGVLKSKELALTVKDEFPSYDEARYLSVKRKATFPFSRRFAIENDRLYFEFLGVIVGECKKSGPELKEDFLYLKEVLHEDMK